MYLEKPLLCNNLNFGEVSCYLALPGLTTTCQMEGGNRIDNVISNGQSIITESPLPKGVRMLTKKLYI
jgi:hypothetical protein